MLDDIEVGNYIKESEIDKAFPYLDELDKEISKLKLQLSELQKNNQTFFQKLFNIKRRESEIDDSIKIKRTYCKKHKFKKDGYEFLLRTTRVYKEIDTSNPYYYEFFVNIKYNFESKNEQFYKRTTHENELKKYFEDMEGVFKHLTRRDLIERLFKIKKEEIESLNKLIKSLVKD